MLILDRYIIRSFLINYVITMFVMISMYIVLDLFVNFDEFTEGGLGWQEVAENIADYYGYNVFLYFAQLSGLITLFAASCTLARMQRANELTAVLAAGTGLYRVAAPVVVLGLLMNALWVLDQELVIPRIAYKLARPHDDVAGMRTDAVWFLKDQDNSLLSALRFSPKDKQLHRIMILQRDRGGALTGLIDADNGVWDERNQAWKLERGRLFRRTAQPYGFGGEDRLAPESVEAYRTSKLTPEYIVLRRAGQWLQFVSLSQLRELEEGRDVDHIQVAMVRHGRFAQPFVNLLLLLIGISFFLSREPTGVLVQATKAVLNCGALFMVAFVSQSMVGIASFPALPAWVPIMIFAPIAVLYMDGLKT